MANQHAAPYNPNPQPPIPEPTHAERSRTLLHLSSVATLSTMSRKQPGFPFGSLMPYALDPTGRPLFLISTMAMHTQNIKSDPRASLFVAQPPRMAMSSEPPGSPWSETSFPSPTRRGQRPANSTSRLTPTATTG